MSLYAIITLSDDFQYNKILFGPKSCHCSRIATLTGVTVIDRSCIESYLFSISPTKTRPADSGAMSAST